MVKALQYEDAVQNNVLLEVTNAECFLENRDVEIYDFELVEQGASVSPLLYLLSAFVLVMVCLSLFDFFLGWQHWR